MAMPLEGLSFVKMLEKFGIIYATDPLASVDLGPLPAAVRERSKFSGRNVDRTLESSGNRAYRWLTVDSFNYQPPVDHAELRAPIF